MARSSGRGPIPCAGRAVVALGTAQDSPSVTGHRIPPATPPGAACGRPSRMPGARCPLGCTGTMRPAALDFGLFLSASSGRTKITGTPLCTGSSPATRAERRLPGRSAGRLRTPSDRRPRRPLGRWWRLGGQFRRWPGRQFDRRPAGRHRDRFRRLLGRRYDDRFRRRLGRRLARPGLARLGNWGWLGVAGEAAIPVVQSLG